VWRDENPSLVSGWQATVLWGPGLRYTEHTHTPPSLSLTYIKCGERYEERTEYYLGFDVLKTEVIQ